MRKDMSNRPPNGSANKCSHPWCFGDSPPCFFMVAVVFVALTLASCDAPEGTHSPPQASHTDSSEGVTTDNSCIASQKEPASFDGTLKMTEEEFEEFLRQRARLSELPWITDYRIQSDKTQEQLQETVKKTRQVSYSGHYDPIVELPDRLVAIAGTSVWINFNEHKTSLFQLHDALPHCPDVVSLHFENFSGQTELISLLQTAQKMPFLHRVSFEKGCLSPDEAAAVAALPFVDDLGLCNCLILRESFAELAKMKRLKTLNVYNNTNITPDCFITLAKLPSFRRFRYSVTDPGPGRFTPFGKPINEETRRAIESLDGRLEVFIAEEIQTSIHCSMIRALLKITSLRELYIDMSGPGELTLDDIQRLQKMPNLSRLSLETNVVPSEDREKADAIIQTIRASLQKKRDLQRWGKSTEPKPE